MLKKVLKFSILYTVILNFGLQSAQATSSLELEIKEFADRRHELVDHEDIFGANDSEALQRAYRELETLGVHIKEPDYDLHKRLASVPQVIALLEDLKSLTTSYRTVSELPFIPSKDFFHEDCIPQAEICALLVVAYGGCIVGG